MYKTERQDIFQTLDETKNHSHKLTVTFRTCLTILEQHFKIFNLILALNVILWLTQLDENIFPKYVHCIVGKFCIQFECEGEYSEG